MVKTLELQESLRKRLLSNVAHELRTPLSAMRGEVEAMMDGIIPVERSQLLSLHEELKRLSRLIEGMEEFSQAQASALTLKKERILLRPFIENIINTFKGSARYISFDIHCEESLTLFADPERLSQILINLLSNAIKALQEKEGQIWIKAGADREGIFIEVGDTGCGIREEDLAFIFERFYRNFKDGLGLGLSIVKELVEAHGGKIGVRSEYGKGTVFTLHFPIHNSS